MFSSKDNILIKTLWKLKDYLRKDWHELFRQFKETNILLLSVKMGTPSSIERGWHGHPELPITLRIFLVLGGSLETNEAINFVINL